MVVIWLASWFHGAPLVVRSLLFRKENNPGTWPRCYWPPLPVPASMIHDRKNYPNALSLLYQMMKINDNASTGSLSFNLLSFSFCKRSMLNVSVCRLLMTYS